MPKMTHKIPLHTSKKNRKWKKKAITIEKDDATTCIIVVTTLTLVCVIPNFPYDQEDNSIYLSRIYVEWLIDHLCLTPLDQSLHTIQNYEMEDRIEDIPSNDDFCDLD